MAAPTSREGSGLVGWESGVAGAMGRQGQPAALLESTDPGHFLKEGEKESNPEGLWE